MKLEKDDIVWIRWIDTKSVACWCSLEQIYDITPAIVFSVGIYDGIRNDGIIIRQHLRDDGHATPTIIPVGCVIGGGTLMRGKHEIAVKDGVVSLKNISKKDIGKEKHL